MGSYIWLSNAKQRYNLVSYSFVGLSGLYYSLQYLSLSDASVLTYLVPFTTGATGALLLHESFTIKEAVAGRKHLHRRIPLGTDSCRSIQFGGSGFDCQAALCL